MGLITGVPAFPVPHRVLSDEEGEKNVDTAQLEARIKALEEQVESQQKKIILLEDIEAIKRLQKAYNYYVEHMLGDAIIDCFADSPEVMLDWLEGKWTGKEGVRQYFARAASGEGPPGFSHQLMPTAGLITVDPDGQKARGRWYVFGGVFWSDRGKVSEGQLVNGIYEMGYIKEDGVWKILSIKWIIPYGVRIPEGWSMPEHIGRRFIKGQDVGSQNRDEQQRWPMPPPDIEIDPNDLRYVSGYIFPFHFNHPVTGRPTTESIRNARLKPVDVDALD
jgi:hypothetical protein